ncbi:hypothetical protein Gotur_017801 [Gossypium turneri]
MHFQNLVLIDLQHTFHILFLQSICSILLIHAIVLDVNFLYITDTVARETLDQVMADAISKSEYCEKYVKPEDVVGVEEVKSSNEKLSEDEYAASDEEEITEK